MKNKLIIFDLDGTLIDSMWIWEEIDNTYLSSKGIPVPENLKNEIDILIGNIKDTKVLNKSLQIKHNSLIDELSEITKLIDESINIKKEILNGDIFKLIEDEKKVQNINKKIDSVNTIYNKINNFSIKF